MRWPNMDESSRCTAKAKRTGRRCERACAPGCRVCRVHGGAAIQVVDAGQRRLQEQKATELARRGVAGLDLSAYSDPFKALEFSVAHSHALAERLAGIVGQIPDDQLRWAGKTGDHVRGEVIVLQKALDSCRGAAADALRLGLDARRAGIQQSTVDMLDAALELALNASGIGLERRAEARAIFRKQIKVRDDEPAA
jgi:hypothetical protein